MVFGVVMPYLYVSQMRPTCRRHVADEYSTPKNPDAANIGSYTAFFYTGFAGLGVALAFFYVPEMKGRSAHEIDRMFDLRLPARDFKRWSDSEEAARDT